MRAICADRLQMETRLGNAAWDITERAEGVKQKKKEFIGLPSCPQDITCAADGEEEGGESEEREMGFM